MSITLLYLSNKIPNYTDYAGLPMAVWLKIPQRQQFNKLLSFGQLRRKITSPCNTWIVFNKPEAHLIQTYYFAFKALIYLG